MALKPGHSLMDWVRLGHSGVDLTGVGGILREVTPDQLAAHSKKNDAWIAIRGKSDHSVTMVLSKLLCGVQMPIGACGYINVMTGLEHVCDVCDGSLQTVCLHSAPCAHILRKFDV